MENTNKNPNPYSDKANNFPNKLINATQNGINDEQIEIIRGITKNYNSIFIEIGSGSGQFLIENAKNNPDSLYIGFEIRYKRSVRTIEKAHKLGLSNLIIVREDASKIKEIFLPNSISGVFINFPDPWSKTRWLKHRIIRQEVLDTISSLLLTGGYLAFKTDHEEYFDWSKNILDTRLDFQIIEISRDLHQSPYNKTNIKTEFEQLFQFQRKNIHYFKVIKV